MLLAKLGGKCPKIVRVYSERLANSEFPIPRVSHTNKKQRRTYELAGNEWHKDIALHHLIRKEGNSFSKGIKAMDKWFEENRTTPEKVNDDDLETYNKLITDACIEEIKKYDVILATCHASPSNRILGGAKVTQVIIDECGMCLEPQSLIPIVAYKPNQVSSG